jgi:DNA-binding transcriptional ArsR family regulator
MWRRGNWLRDVRLSTIGTLLITVLAVLVTSFFLLNLTSPPFGHGTASGGIAEEVLGVLALPVTTLSWAMVGLAFIVDRNGRLAMRKAGVDEEVYDVMVKMRGAKSRLAILRSMDKPRHRSELAEITGLDWKEVDRDLELLEKYGIVSLFAESGAIKIYGLTQQGRLLVDLLTEMLKD